MRYDVMGLITIAIEILVVFILVPINYNIGRHKSCTRKPSGNAIGVKCINMKLIEGEK